MFNLELHPAEQICFILRRICDMGIGTISGGGASVCDESGNIWMSPKGKAKSELKPEMIARYLPDGTPCGQNRGSTEAPVFLAMHKARPDKKAVIHSHAPAMLAYMLARRQPDMKMTAHTCGLPVKTAYVPFRLAGSRELTESAAEAFATGADILLLEGHGTFIGGDNIYDAFAKLEILENMANTALAAETSGYAVRPLSDGQIERFLEKKERQNIRTAEYGTDSMEEYLLRRELAVIAERAYREKHILSCSGSVSVRISERAFFITPAFADYFDLRPEELIRVENGVCEAGKTPPDDIDIHMAVYGEHRDIHSLMTAVSANVMTFAVTDMPFCPNADFEVYMIVHDTKKVPFDKDAADIAKALSVDTPGVIVENRCFVAAAASNFDPIRCLGIVQCADVLGQLESRTAGCGMKLQYLDRDMLEEIYKSFW